MSIEKSKSNIVFAVYPNANGFGFVYMANARKLIDFGVVRLNPINNMRILRRIEKSLDYMKPSLLILQDPYGNSSRTGKRVRSLIQSIIKFSEGKKLKVVQYNRDQIRNVFKQLGAVTKYEISQVLITEFKELESRLPKKRVLWASEDRNKAIFDALSLALTWFYLNS